MAPTTPGPNNLDTTDRPIDDLTTAPQVAADAADLPGATAAVTAETRTDIASILTTASPGVEERTLIPEEIERRTNLLLGDGYLKRGQLDRAREAYAAAGVEIPMEKLVACGDVCLREGRFYDAGEAYAAAAMLGAGA